MRVRCKECGNIQTAKDGRFCRKCGAELFVVRKKKGDK
jgi:rRNA maturation endonuclease Nob1